MIECVKHIAQNYWIRGKQPNIYRGLHNPLFYCIILNDIIFNMNNIGLEKFYDLCQLYNIPDNLIGDLLRQFKETPNANDVVASPKILQVIDGGKYEWSIKGFSKWI